MQKGCNHRKGHLGRKSGGEKWEIVIEGDVEIIWKQMPQRAELQYFQHLTKSGLSFNSLRLSLRLSIALILCETALKINKNPIQGIAANTVTLVTSPSAVVT